MKLRLSLRRYSYLVYLALGVALAILSVLFLMMSVGYMERAMVATSLVSMLVGFTLLSSSLYVLRLSSYVYAASREPEG